jgi:GNAT superfamily N-acetyltransferase
MKHPSYHIRTIDRGDRAEVATLIFHSLNAYYASIGRGALLEGDPISAAVFFDVYSKTDPGEGLVVEDDESGRIIGSCFVHPRETHFSLGIMNVHQDHFGRGVARCLMRAITDRAGAEGKPVRLISSCFNLDSYSLYTRGGFVPFQTFQDMWLEVPESGLPFPAPGGTVPRKAVPGDAEAMAAIELEVSGISRLEDYRYLLRNEEGIWSVSVIDGAEGLEGFLVSCDCPLLNLLGPGVARTEQQSAALIHAQLDETRGRSPLMIVPVQCGQLVAQLYQWGARNCEMHIAQSFGPATVARGVVMPTFLPETG